LLLGIRQEGTVSESPYMGIAQLKTSQATHLFCVHALLQGSLILRHVQPFFLRHGLVQSFAHGRVRLVVIVHLIYTNQQSLMDEVFLPF